MAAEATLSAVAPSSTQLLWRGRFERVLALAAPALDLLLAAGDRASRLADREPPGAALAAPEREPAGTLAEPR
jgi:hypothetical protein